MASSAVHPKTLPPKDRGSTSRPLDPRGTRAGFVIPDLLRPVMRAVAAPIVKAVRAPVYSAAPRRRERSLPVA